MTSHLFSYPLIPKDRNFKPTAAQLNQLFNQFAEYHHVFRVHEFLPKKNAEPLTSEKIQNWYRNFEYHDLENYIEADRYKHFGSTYYKDLFAQRKNNPNIGLESNDTESYTARHILIQADHMRPSRIAYCQHFYEHEINLKKYGSKQYGGFPDGNKDVYATAYWIDFPELDQLDLTFPDTIETYAAQINALSTQGLILDFEDIPIDAGINEQPFYFSYPSRHSLVETLVRQSVQMRFQKLELINQPTANIDIFWGINNNQGMSPKIYSRFSYCEIREGSSSYLAPEVWLALESSQLQIRLLKESMQQAFEFFCQGKYVCEV